MRVTQWKTSQNPAGNQIPDGEHKPCADEQEGCGTGHLQPGRCSACAAAMTQLRDWTVPEMDRGRVWISRASDGARAKRPFALSAGAEPGYNIPWEPHFEESLHPTPYGANDCECFRPHSDYLLSVRIVHSRDAHAAATRDWCSRPGKFSSSETEMHQRPQERRRALNGKSGKRLSLRRRFSANSMRVNGRRNASGKPLATRRGNGRRLR
jgi:hypothetical protein